MWTGCTMGLLLRSQAGLLPETTRCASRSPGSRNGSGPCYVTSGATVTVTQTLRVGTPTPTQSPTQTSGTGSVAVSSNPSGAQVFMDNMYEGITPLTISPVQPGTHSFLIKQAGYADWQVSEPVQSGQTVADRCHPLPAPNPDRGGNAIDPCPHGGGPSRLRVGIEKKITIFEISVIIPFTGSFTTNQDQHINE